VRETRVFLRTLGATLAIGSPVETGPPPGLRYPPLRRITLALEGLAAGGIASRHISKLGAGAKGEIYLIRGGGDLRIIIRRTEDVLEVLDIVRHDKLQQVYDTFQRGGGAV
jgi:hypothetical protein